MVPLWPLIHSAWHMVNTATEKASEKCATPTSGQFGQDKGSVQVGLNANILFHGHADPAEAAVMPPASPGARLRRPDAVSHSRHQRRHRRQWYSARHGDGGNQQRSRLSCSGGPERDQPSRQSQPGGSRRQTAAGTRIAASPRKVRHAVELATRTRGFVSPPGTTTAVARAAPGNGSTAGAVTELDRAPSSKKSCINAAEVLKANKRPEDEPDYKTNQNNLKALQDQTRQTTGRC